MWVVRCYATRRECDDLDPRTDRAIGLTRTRAWRQRSYRMNVMMGWTGINDFLCLFPWEPTETAKGTVLRSPSLPLGVPRSNLARLQYPVRPHPHNRATRRSISVSYVSIAAEPALRAPPGGLWPMSAPPQPGRADVGRGRFRNLGTRFTGGMRKFPASMHILSLILAVRQL